MKSSSCVSTTSSQATSPDTLRFRAQVSYGKSDAPQIGTVVMYQANIDPAPNTGTSLQFRIPRSHPWFGTFLEQSAGSGVLLADQALISSADMFLSGFFGAGGAPHLPAGEGMMPRAQLENWNVVAAFEGDFNGSAGDWLHIWQA